MTRPSGAVKDSAEGLPQPRRDDSAQGTRAVGGVSRVCRIDNVVPGLLRGVRVPADTNSRPQAPHVSDGRLLPDEETRHE